MQTLSTNLLTAVAVAGLCSTITLGQMAVTPTLPLMNANNISRTTQVSVTFDRPIDRITVVPANFHVFGKVTGPLTGS